MTQAHWMSCVNGCASCRKAEGEAAQLCCTRSYGRGAGGVGILVPRPRDDNLLSVICYPTPVKVRACARARAVAVGPG